MSGVAEPADGSALCTCTPDGVRLRLRVTPRAARNAIAGIVAEADGGAALKVTVTAAPEDGKANAAVVKLLAKAWKVPKSSIRIVSGQTDRRKGIAVDGDAEALKAIIGRTAEG